MRFKSRKSQGYQVFAVTGVNTVSFGIHADEEVRRGLLGFAVERIDSTEGERYIMPGFKVFHSVIPNPTETTSVSTWEHPVQSFVWDDFTAKPDRAYEYLFHPVKGTPKNLQRGRPVSIRVHTEPLFSTQPHDVFFNRGVASSQAYQRKFGDTPIDKLKPEKRAEALKWLTRDLEDAIKKFIAGAAAGDTLLCCFYEFRYRPVADALMEAIARGVDVRLIVDAKVNETTDKDGTFHPSFPREDNLKLLRTVKFPRNRLTLREARPDAIQHNKFMVRLKGGAEPVEVWTGSTNISQGGFAGQTNVGHWVRDAAVAEQYRRYWQLLSQDPGARAGDDAATAKKKNAALRAAVAALQAAPTSRDQIAPGATAVFSPRAGLQVLDLYVRLVDDAEVCACITLAFGINKAFKNQLGDNTAESQIVFMLLEKRDRQNARSKTPFVALTAGNNVYQAWGSFLQNPVYQWARETNTRKLDLNTHVAYVHSKFLLRDPLGAEPIVVTGSANFSEPSTNDNDENMVLVRGDLRVADIYFTEFNRLFNHYYFRSVTEALAEQRKKAADGGQAGKDEAAKKDAAASLFLAEDDAWIQKYVGRTLKAKRLALYTGMENAATLEPGMDIRNLHLAPKGRGQSRSRRPAPRIG